MMAQIPPPPLHLWQLPPPPGRSAAKPIGRDVNRITFTLRSREGDHFEMGADAAIHAFPGSLLETIGRDVFLQGMPNQCLDLKANRSTVAWLQNHARAIYRGESPPPLQQQVMFEALVLGDKYLGPQQSNMLLGFLEHNLRPSVAVALLVERAQLKPPAPSDRAEALCCRYLMYHLHDPRAALAFGTFERHVQAHKRFLKAMDGHLGEQVLTRMRKGQSSSLVNLGPAFIYYCIHADLADLATPDFAKVFERFAELNLARQADAILEARFQRV